MGNRTVGLCLAAFLFMVPGVEGRHANDARKVPFRLYRNHLVVATGKLGSIADRNLLIDTGANPTVVDEALAYELGLKPIARPGGRMSIIGGVVQTYHAILSNLDLGPVHRESLPVAVANLSLLQAVAGLRIDAIVGLDTIEPNNFQIDYESRKITFGVIRNSSSVPMVQSRPFVLVETRVNGATVNLAVDTGSSELVLFRDRFPDSMVTLRVAKKIQLSNVAGDIVVPQIQLTEFQVGNADFSDSMAVLALAPSCCDFDGILGISGLRFKRVSFDFEHRRLGLEVPDREEPGFPGTPCEFGLARARCEHDLRLRSYRP